MVHQSNGLMFKNQVLIISTAAGAGTKSAINDVKDSMDFWGIARVSNYSKVIWAAHWNEITDKKNVKMDKEILKVAEKIRIIY